MLKYHNQWELEQKITDNLKVPKVVKDNWAKIMEAIVLHHKLVRGVQGLPLAYVVRQHVMVANISPEFDAYLILDEEMIANAP